MASKPFVVKNGLSVNDTTVIGTNGKLHANNTITDGTITGNFLEDSGSPTGTFGSASQVPVVTVDAKGRITNISNTNVAGVTALTYTAANNTLKIDTADGSNFTATIDQLEWDAYMTVANTQALHTSITANLNSYIANTNPRIISILNIISNNEANTVTRFANVDSAIITANTRITNTLTSLNSTNTALRTIISNNEANTVTRLANVDSAIITANTRITNTLTSLNSTNTALRTIISNNEANTVTRLDDRMTVANTQALVNSRLGATSSVTLTGHVTGSASFSSNAVSITTDLDINALSANTQTITGTDLLAVYSGSDTVKVSISDAALVGPTGPTGPTGPAGADGAAGPTGPAGADGGFTTDSDAQVNSLGVGVAANGTGGNARFLNRISVGDGNGTPFLNTGSPGIWMSYNGGSTGFMGMISTTEWGVYMGEWRFRVTDAGNVTALGTISASSDIKLKDNIEPITDALHKVKSVRGVNYTRNDMDDDRIHMGVIAQEIEEVMPELVFENDDHKTVAYGNMVGVLIEAIKEMDTKYQAEIESLKSEIENLKGK
jgi:hypothetical protein